MEYSNKKTTREERVELVKKALAISISGAEMPTNETLKSIKKYINGKKELEEVQKEIVERYKKL